MGKTYTDNALNRRLGRVGLPHGSMPQTSSVSNVNVDTASSGRLGHVSEPNGNAIVPEPRMHVINTNVRSASRSTPEPRVYVDNAENRRLGRVGQPYGMARVSEHGEHSASANSRSSRSSPTIQKKEPESDNKSTSGTKLYADNAQNRRIGRVGQPHGTAVVSKGRNMSTVQYERNIPPSASTSSVVPNRNNAGGVDISSTTPKEVVASDDRLTKSTKVYADNAQNRRVGRVGQPHGTAVVSKGQNMSAVQYERNISPSLSISSSIKNSNYAEGVDFSSTAPKESLAREEKVYVDNVTNRRLGRVGQPYGYARVTAQSVHSPDTYVRNDDKSTNSTRVNADNTTDCQVDRAYQSIGSDRVPKSRIASPPVESLYHERYTRTKQSCSSLSLTFNSLVPNAETQEKTNVDKSYNRKPGCIGDRQCSSQRFYVDNPQNRLLNRVGLPIGAKVFSAKTKGVTTKLYADTQLNRKLGRVGMPQGSMPRKSIATYKIPEMIEKLINKDITEAPNEGRHYAACNDTDNTTASIDPSRAAIQQAICHYNRKLAEESWQMTKKEPPKTDMAFLKDYKGTKIDYGDLRLQRMIGRGGFGEVYFAKWHETVVAVKVLRVEKMSEKDISAFADEVMHFSLLNHPNIVTFIGACTVQPDVCIVMEYMQLSLFDALHVRKIEFSDEETLSIMQQVCKGIKYLHERRIAHCDIKTANILMDFVENKICEVKITDFGLSMIRQHSTISLSYDEADKRVRYRGTPRYSAPEILRGEILSAKDMMKADIYSLGLVLFEVIYSEEPYHDFTAIQMQQQVGGKGVTPEIPEDILVDNDVLDVIYEAWSFEPKMRPRAGEISDVLNRTVCIFMEE